METARITVSIFSRYLITTPRIYRTGTVETLNVNLYDNKGSWNITANLRIKDRTIATATQIFQGDSQGTMKMKVGLVNIFLFLKESP